MSKSKFQTEWQEIDDEYQQLQETHKVYRQKLEELTNLQATCSSAISKQRKCLKDLRHSLSKCAQSCDEKELKVISDIKTQIKDKENVFFDMEAYLPKRNGLYLNLVLGNVNVTLLSNQAKFAYKDEYEKFKLCMTIILMLGAITCLFFLNSRVTDEIFNFLLVWYYCTLTIRESILMSNGSRIKGWWVLHHYVSTFLSGVMLTWFCSVSPVLLPEWLLVQTESFGGEKSTGPYSGGISVVDVERTHFSLAFSLFWPFLATVQFSNSVSTGRT
ncbi:transmembrane protein 120B isoform X2 [Gouania willdenowi]|uniref:transmembrane protein 120B isoform X2 n=1 Tax=Gouania willdenowi TaxID=441366 RepID=UPI0010544408|nr:transmembrane protein 120B isoform X2 [Gouania willdenowi]